MRSRERDKSALVLPFPTNSPARRSVLAAALGLTLAGALAGCTDRVATSATPPPSADELAVDRAVAAARRLRLQALALARTQSPLAPLVRQIAADHTTHLAALGASVAVPSATSSASPTAPTVTGSQLITAEWKAARTALRDGEAATPVFAVLLGRIAAARATHADLLSAHLGRPAPGSLTPVETTDSTSTSAAAGPTDDSTSTATPTDPAATDAPTNATDDAVPPDPAPTDTLQPPSTPALIALNRVLAGQHAAVFAYPLIIARTKGNQQQLARNLWQLHRNDRDLLTERLLAAGVAPADSAAAYAVRTPPGATTAVALAVKVEQGLAALSADAVAAATGADRALAADQLVLAARRTAGWTSKPQALPGLTETTAATPTPTATT